MNRARIELWIGDQYVSSEKRDDDAVRALLFALGYVAEHAGSKRLQEVSEAAWAPVIRNPQDSDPTPQCQMTLDATGRRCGRTAAAVARAGGWKGYVCEEDVPRARGAGYAIEPMTP